MKDELKSNDWSGTRTQDLAITCQLLYQLSCSEKKFCACHKILSRFWEFRIQMMVFRMRIKKFKIYILTNPRVPWHARYNHSLNNYSIIEIISSVNDKKRIDRLHMFEEHREKKNVVNMYYDSQHSSVDFNSRQINAVIKSKWFFFFCDVFCQVMINQRNSDCASTGSIIELGYS
jgi:hypothetical protein